MHISSVLVVISLLIDFNLVVGQSTSKNVEILEMNKEVSIQANRAVLNKGVKCSEEGPECQEHTIKCCGTIPCKSNLGINFIPVTDPTFAPLKLQSTHAATTTQNPNCKGPKCPTPRCEKDTKLFDSNGDMFEDTAIFKNLINICGKTYGFSKVAMTMEIAHKLCCSFGMKLMSIDNMREFLCLSSRMEKEPGGTQYIISGRDEGCEGKFGWCTTGECISSDIPWANSNQPDNYNGKEHCVTLAKLANIGLNDIPCHQVRQFICESNSTTGSGPFFNETACPIIRPDN